MMVVRPEAPTDLSAIHAVHASCFPNDREARLVRLLRDADQLLVSLVAEIDGAVVGHIAFSPVTVEAGRAGAGLAPVAVLAAHQRQGIGRALTLSGLEACRGAGICWVVVLGEPEYYCQFGFEPASKFGLIDEYGGGSAFQAIELNRGEIPIGAGVVKYAPQFASLEE